MTPDLRLRPATAADVLSVWRWRNDPESRAASRRSEEVPYSTHEAWFARVLADSDHTLLIATTGEGETIGMVRLDPLRGGETEISINVAPEWRGRGAGTELIRQLVQREPGRRLVAEVRPENLRSVRLFERCAFTRRGEADGMIVFER